MSNQFAHGVISVGPRTREARNDSAARSAADAALRTASGAILGTCAVLYGLLIAHVAGASVTPGVAALLLAMLSGVSATATA